MNTEKKFKSSGPPRMKIRVTNTTDGRKDYHEGLTKWDIEWIKANPRLKVDILEVRTARYKPRK